MFDIKQKPKTDEEIATDELVQMDSLSTEGLGSLKRYTESAYNKFWNGEVSPTIKAQILGTELYTIFMKSSQTNQFIKSMDDSWVVQTIPEGVEVVWGNDGSGVITDNRHEEIN